MKCLVGVPQMAMPLILFYGEWFCACMLAEWVNGMSLLRTGLISGRSSADCAEAVTVHHSHGANCDAGAGADYPRSSSIVLGCCTSVACEDSLPAFA